MALASRTTLPQPKAPLTVLNLPPEILLHILEFAFADNREIFLYKNINQRGGIISVGEYAVNRYLQLLFVCKQFYQDAHLWLSAAHPLLPAVCLWPTTSRSDCQSCIPSRSRL